MNNLSTRRLLSLSKADTLAFFKAYFDESGTHESSPVVIVAGAIAEDVSWNALCYSWNAVLKEYGVKRFHATDLNARRGEFSGWSDEKRNEFYGKLVEIMRIHLTIFIGNGLRRSDFDEVSLEFPDVKLTDYQMLLEQATYTVHLWAVPEKNVEEVAIFVAYPEQNTQTPTLGLLQEGIKDSGFRKESKITDFIITKRVEDPPFQVADAACHPLFRFHKYGGLLNEHMMKTVLQFANETQKTYTGRFFDKNAIRNWFLLRRDDHDIIVT